jgi:hypothetical protein
MGFSSLFYALAAVGLAALHADQVRFLSAVIFALQRVHLGGYP